MVCLKLWVCKVLIGSVKVWFILAMSKKVKLPSFGETWSFRRGLDSPVPEVVPVGEFETEPKEVRKVVHANPVDMDDVDVFPPLRTWYGLVTRCAHSERICKSMVDRIDKQPCYYIQLINNRFEARSPIYDRDCETFLRKLLGDGLVKCKESRQATDEPSLHVQDGAVQFLVEIGPKLRYRTPWGTNVVNMCQAAGLTLQRIEMTWRYLVTLKQDSDPSDKETVIEKLHDPSLEYEMTSPLITFYDELVPHLKIWEEVPVIAGGMSILRSENEKQSFGFDEQDLSYYLDLFTNRLQRNPTRVELCDLAQSNSEHSRHWFFKGKYIMDGVEVKHSLMDMVIDTNGPTTNQNNVIKFHDNSSAMSGFEIPCIEADDPTDMSRLGIRIAKKHLLMTAETHNFPTGVAPFSGAATGAGGRLRDVMAAGRGGTVVAATVGYCVGQLQIDSYPLQWEQKWNYAGAFEPPKKIIIDASNGASDYGNKFGEPVIGGFFRSFGGRVDKERREWIKPIMFSAGIGMLDEMHVDKITVDPRKQRICIAKIGGPAYRIGIGGGSASSVMIQGMDTARTKNAVQRGDPEMGNRLNRFVRACIEMRDKNPILSIHDQGAGGNANVLKEIVAGHGADVFATDFTLGDNTLTLKELWCAEYQESNAILVKRANVEVLQKLAKRERCQLDIVGTVLDSGTFRFLHCGYDKLSERQPVPVNFPLTTVMDSMPRKTFLWSSGRQQTTPLIIGDDITPVEASKRVLKLPSVASKRFLTSKVDRSVTGLIAQQQCVGPFQLPLADLAVTACSFFSHKGIATSIGEQPIMTLVSPSAGARMSLMEALASIVMAPITCLKDMKCSVNWMWPAKLEGEGCAMYEACEALCGHMKLLGVGIDGGKDSLAMAAQTISDNKVDEVVKAPGTVVVSAYAPCTDITKVVTPDIKGPRRSKNSRLLWVRPVVQCMARLGGSALAQVYEGLGVDSPDVTDEDAAVFVKAFACMQVLVNDRKLMACHDVSEGGLFICLVEMAMAGGCGINIIMPELLEQDNLFAQGEDKAPISLATLYSEEVGWVIEVQDCDLAHVKDVLMEILWFDIGAPNMDEKDPEVVVVSADGAIWVELLLEHFRVSWETTSYVLDTFQTNVDCAKEEYDYFRKQKRPDCYWWDFQFRPIHPSLLELASESAHVAASASSPTGLKSGSASPASGSSASPASASAPVSGSGSASSSTSPSSAASAPASTPARPPVSALVPARASISEPALLSDQALLSASESQPQSSLKLCRPLSDGPCVAILREEGINGDREMAAAFMMAGFNVYDVTMTDLYDAHVDIDRFRGIAFPGGFSFADSVGAAVGWSASLKASPYAGVMLQMWRSKPGTFSLAVCNGCQLTALLGWQNLDGGQSYDYQDTPDHRYTTNNSERFESRWARVKIGKTDNIMLRGMEDSVLGVWVAHKEGRFVCKDEVKVEDYEKENRIAFRYVDDSNQITTRYPHNPNGSVGGIAGISSKDGRHLALMPHPERCFLPWQWADQGALPHVVSSSASANSVDPANKANDGIQENDVSATAPWAKLFQNAYDWCMKPDPTETLTEFESLSLD